MTIVQFQYILAVAQYKNFSVAAKYASTALGGRVGCAYL